MPAVRKAVRGVSNAIAMKDAVHTNIFWPQPGQSPAGDTLFWRQTGPSGGIGVSWSGSSTGGKSKWAVC
jgi:hypothetical protein